MTTVTPVTRLRRDFDIAGFLNLGPLLSLDEVGVYGEIYNRFLDGTIDAGNKRSDLGAGVDTEPAAGARENITQIMWPSALYPPLLDLPLHRRALCRARELVGDDMVLDFDMLIDKAPNTAVPTPWHQDAGYWVDLPDKRAVSIWVALDQATLENGCMWYVHGSHRTPLRPHWPAGKGGGAIECECSEDEPGATYVPLGPGEAAAHAGYTLHYSRGNSTDGHRRAYILNFRSATMIELERQRGMDHGLNNNERLVRNLAGHRQR